MEKLMKFFPFLPTPHDGGKLAVALVFYILALIVGLPLGVTVMTLTVVLVLLVPVYVLALPAYCFMGIVLSFVRFAANE